MFRPGVRWGALALVVLVWPCRAGVRHAGVAFRPGAGVRWDVLALVVLVRPSLCRCSWWAGLGCAGAVCVRCIGVHAAASRVCCTGVCAGVVVVAFVVLHPGGVAVLALSHVSLSVSPAWRSLCWRSCGVVVVVTVVFIVVVVRYGRSSSSS